MAVAFARHDADGVEGADLDAAGAAVAALRVNGRNPVRRDNRVADVEAADGVHHAARAAAAVADVAHVALDVVARLGQPGVLRLLQNLHRLPPGDALGDALPRQHLRPAVEAEAGAQGVQARVAGHLGVVAAGAQRDGVVAGVLDDGRGPLPVQHLGVVVGGQCLLVDQAAANLGLPVEDGVGELAILEQVLVKQPRQFLDRVVFADAHEGELEEADDDGREGDIPLAVVLQVEDEAALGHARDHVGQFGLGYVRPPRQATQRDEGGRHAAGQVGLDRGEQQLEDAQKGGGGRRACGVAVQALLEQAVRARDNRQRFHRDLSGTQGGRLGAHTLSTGHRPGAPLLGDTKRGPAAPGNSQRPYCSV